MTDSPDDLAAFLMHRSVDPELSEQDRLAIYVLVDAYQDGEDPQRVFNALRAAANRFQAHPDYRPEWALHTDDQNVTIIGVLERLQATERRLHPIRQVKAGVLSTAYYEAGPPGGPAVLLLHGFPYDIHSFSDVIPRLVQAGRRVIVPYLRGFGPTRFLSDSTPRSGQQAALGADVIALMDALDIPTAVLAGFDWGGRAACVAAALWPDRCAGLVTVNSYLIQDISAAMVPIRPDLEAGLWYFYYFLTERGRAGLTANRDEVAQVIWTRNSPNWHYSSITFQRAAAAFTNPDFVQVVLHSYRHRLGQAPGDPAYATIESDLAGLPPIGAPTVTLDGMADGNFPATDGTATAHHFTGPRRHHQVPGAGHNLPQETPAAFAGAILSLTNLLGAPQAASTSPFR